MANVLAIRRKCDCTGCSEGRILARWKNANKILFELGESIYPISILMEKNLPFIRKRIKDDDISHVVLFVNLDCTILPELAKLDSIELEEVAKRLILILPNCDIYGVLHLSLSQASSQEQYAVACLRNTG